MQYLKQRIPEGMEDLVDYSDANYVTATLRRAHPTPAQQDDQSINQSLLSVSNAHRES